MKYALILLSFFLTGNFFWTTAYAQPETEAIAYLIPIEGEINSPQLYILRRGLKEATRNGIDTVIIQINTPGGSLDTTMEMMDAIQNFQGTIIAYVDDEAISAGAIIAIVTDKIFFAPAGIMGAAAAIQATGQDIPETLTLKVYSYLQAKVRTTTAEYRYRSDLLRAMMDKDYALIIDGKTIKASGELLTLTAQEAVAFYGEPAEPLLSSGIASSAQDVLSQYNPSASYTLEIFQLTWSETLAKWLSSIAPLLMGVGLLLLFIEFKTPGFGIFGAGGVACLLLVFASHYIAGLAGYEEVLVFLCSLMLIFLEVFLFPGTIVLGLLGLIGLVGSLLWAMADIWPGGQTPLNADLFLIPVINLSIGIVIAIAGFFLIARFLPKSLFWDKLFLKQEVPPTAPYLGIARDPQAELPPLGARGVTATDLFPSGQVVINNKRFEAHVSVGFLKAGTPIVVKAYNGFFLLVEELKSSKPQK